ncbi:hypothetical protein Bca101_098946 [Brassica carinata]
MASPVNPSSEINGGIITGEEIQLQDHSKITSSDSEARLSLEKMSVESADSLNSDKSLAPSGGHTGCAVEETSREVGRLISKSATPELAGSTFPQPQLQGAWTKPLVIAGAVGSSTIALHDTAMENSEWPALSTKDTSRKKDHAVVVRSKQYILHAPATAKPATPKEDTSRTCDEMIDKVNSTDVDDIVSLATISELENMYESPSVICINKTIESPPTESAPTKQQTETSVTQTSTEVCKESSRIQEIDLGSNQFASLTSLEGEEEFQLDLDESSGPIDLLTPSGKRLLRERPVKPSAKGMEWQSQSMSRGRGNRGRGNRGKLR